MTQIENKGENMDKIDPHANFDKLEPNEGKDKAEKTKKLQSVVKMPDEIIWEIDVGNKFIRTSVLNDDLSLTISIEGRKFNIRSPDYRLVSELEELRRKEQDNSISDDELQWLNDLQIEMVEDMIIDFKFSDRSIRISSVDVALLIILCWRYHAFLMQRSVAIESLSISGSKA